MTPAWSSLLWFAVIVVAIPALLLLIKHSPLGRLHGLKPQAGDCPLRPLSTLALSPSQKVVTVEVGHGPHRRWLVLGVTPGSITALHQIDPADGGDPADVQPLPTGAVDASRAAGTATTSAAVLPFGQLLARLRGQPTDIRHG